MVNEKRTIEKHEQLIEELKTLNVPEEYDEFLVDNDVCKVYDSRLNESLKDLEALEGKPEWLEDLMKKAFRNTDDLSNKSVEDVTSKDSLRAVIAAHKN